MAFLLPRSVFIHVPKTGGQWVTAALPPAGVPLEQLGVVHTSPDEIEDEPERRRRAFVFAVVRHPLTWYQSRWAHQTDDEWEPIDALDWFTPRWIEFWAEFREHCASFDFQEFVRLCVAHYPEGLVSTLYEAYTAGCDFVGRQERLREDLLEALARAGESFDPARLHATPARNVRGGRPARRGQSLYTRELLELALEAESRAIARFGYEEVPGHILERLAR
jgi:hypothetical protein